MAVSKQNRQPSKQINTNESELACDCRLTITIVSQKEECVSTCDGMPTMHHAISVSCVTNLWVSASLDDGSFWASF